MFPLLRVGSLLLLMNFPQLTYAESYCVDSENGDDTNDGICDLLTGSGAPWKSLRRVFDFSNTGAGFQPGDGIYLRRDQDHVNANGHKDNLFPKFSSSGEIGSPIVIDAYGSVQTVDGRDVNKPVVRLRVSKITDTIKYLTDVNPWEWDESGVTGVWKSKTQPGEKPFNIAGVWENEIPLKKASAPACSDGYWYHAGQGEHDLYYKPKNGNPPESNTVHIDRYGVLEFDDQSYITIRNLHFRTSQIPIRFRALNNVIQGVTIEHNDFFAVNTAAYLSATSYEIRDTVFNYNYVNKTRRALQLEAQIEPVNNHVGVDIGYNILLDCNEPAVSTFEDENLYLQNINNATVHHNWIEGGRCAGIGTWSGNGGTAHNNRYEYNFIHNIHGVDDWAARAITVGCPGNVDGCTNNLLRYNVILDTDVGIHAVACPVSGGPAGCVAHNNTLVGNAVAARLRGGSKDWEFRNNIFANPIASTTVPVALHILREQNGSNFQFHSNLYYPNVSQPESSRLWRVGADVLDPFNSNVGTFYDFSGWQNWLSIPETNSQAGLDPLFVNSSGTNPEAFKFIPGSPALDKGEFVGATTDSDYFGNARLGVPDIGAFEFGAGDSDGDGVSDYNEVCYSGDCTVYDPYDATTNPDGGDLNVNKADTDGDGFEDGAELAAGFDPLNSSSAPGLPVAAPLLSRPVLIVLCVFLIVLGASALRNRS